VVAIRPHCTCIVDQNVHVSQFAAREREHVLDLLLLRKIRGVILDLHAVLGPNGGHGLLDRALLAESVEQHVAPVGCEGLSRTACSEEQASAQRCEREEKRRSSPLQTQQNRTFAMPNPIPLVDPVTSATLPAMCLTAMLSSACLSLPLCNAPFSELPKGYFSFKPQNSVERRSK
jgi:hypothetical protein